MEKGSTGSGLLGGVRFVGQTVVFDQIIKHHDDSDGDTGVRDIKSRPVVPTYIDIQKIDDFFIDDTIDQIADRSTENQNQSPVYELPPSGRLMKKYQDRTQGHCRKTDENQTLDIRIIIRKQSKSHSGVSDMGDRKKLGKHHESVIQWNMR